MKTLKIKKLRAGAIIPTRATTGSAGYDLSALTDEDIIIKVGEVKKVPTGIALDIDSNEYAVFIYARSGLATKHGITPANCVGVVDSDYRGEVLVFLQNSGRTDFVIKNGDRIAQMVITKVELPTIVEVSDLTETERGEGGFGSTSV